MPKQASWSWPSTSNTLLRPKQKPITPSFLKTPSVVMNSPVSHSVHAVMSFAIFSGLCVTIHFSN